MFDYVRPRHWSTKFLRLILIQTVFFCFISFREIQSVSFQHRSSLQTILRLRHAQEHRKLLRIIYFREFDSSINVHRLTMEIKNLTITNDIDVKFNILDQSKALLTIPLCSIIDGEARDTIIIADLYTKEIDLISRSLKIPTIAITNRYQLVQGKQV